MNKTFLITFISTLSLASLIDAKSTTLSPLPEAVSNNAVAKITIKDKTYLLSFSGLGGSKTYKDVHNKAFAYDVTKNTWQKIKNVPIEKPINKLTGRLASTAIGIKDSAYIFGGYTVAKDHSEVSIPDVYRYQLTTNTYSQLAPMPVPVDDSVALNYQDRYIYLISGWHNDGNVNLIQVYDIKTNTWQQASPFPGHSVFGQAGGIVDNKIVICDGVKLDYHYDKRRTFSAEPACYLGIINQKSPYKIDWRKLNHPTGKARYRMASLGLQQQNEIAFIGGSDNPYNYNGIGYNGKPSTASNQLWLYDLKTNKWQVKKLSKATMDHRGLLGLNGQLLTIGGMGLQQKVLSTINIYPLATK